MWRICPLTAVVILAGFLCLSPMVFAQTESATISGKVTDASGAVLAGAEIQFQSVERGTTTKTSTNGSGIYVLSGVRPGHYNIEVQHPGFRQVNALGLIVNVQDRIEENFQLQVGSSIESVTVRADTPLLDTEDGTVSTVVDRNFADNLPLNGRSFQGLIELSPGVVVTPNNGFSNGQFSVNGQRASANYWTVDGVSANIGTTAGTIPANGLSGSVGGVTVQGGTNGLVSVDALQEFRIQTSTFAPEFGRTPGGQISIVTRSGTNNWHGSAFDYFRNDVLDANGWFADHLGLPKPKEKQNDFGGTIGGPILANNTFFFFSYEGLRLRLPQTSITDVPDMTSRQDAIPAMQPFLNAFPQPNGPPDPAAGPNVAFFNASYSNASSLNAYSLRLDQAFDKAIRVFARYDYAPSELLSRGGDGGTALNNIQKLVSTTQTATAGISWNIKPTLFNDFRLNYSTTRTSSFQSLDRFGGAVPLGSLPFPSGFNLGDASLSLFFGGLANGSFSVGTGIGNTQRQYNVIDTLSMQLGSHTLKTGVDYRRLSPTTRPWRYLQFADFLTIPDAESGSSDFAQIQAINPATFLFHNFSAFAEDTWRISSRLTATYGFRWDVDVTPSTYGPQPAAVVGFNVLDLSQLALAPPGTQLYHTPYGNVAPRIGLAYQIHESDRWSSVVRGGFGVFYDLATSEMGNTFFSTDYPFGAEKDIFGSSYPLTTSDAAPPVIARPGPNSFLNAVDPHLNLPYTLEWNLSFEQGIGKDQVLSTAYVGSAGRRLIQTLNAVLPTFADVNLLTNSATSDYEALQIKLDRRLSHGLQAIASYSWSHSIDSASAGSSGNLSDLLVPGIGASANRASSDFDIRHSLNVGLTYQLPGPRLGNALSVPLAGWSLQSSILARSAAPVDITDSNFDQTSNGFLSDIRPDLVPGQPVYLHGSSLPGGKGFNPAAFADPPTDANFLPIRQGTTPRNFLRGFGALQWDFAVHRVFPIRESVQLQFRAEMFNLLNHPNFAPPNAGFPLSNFGVSTQLLNQSLAGSFAGSGGFDPLYQVGGPRSIQLALKLVF